MVSFDRTANRTNIFGKRNQIMGVSKAGYTLPAETALHCNYPCIHRWQYFGTNKGLIRLYPGREWDTNFAGFYNDYDPRIRPW